MVWWGSQCFTKLVVWHLEGLTSFFRQRIFSCTWCRSCLSMEFKSSKETCERLDPWLWTTSLMVGVVEMVCLVVEFKTLVLMNNFESFWNVSCFVDCRGGCRSFNLTLDFGCFDFHFFGGLSSCVHDFFVWEYEDSVGENSDLIYNFHGENSDLIYNFHFSFKLEFFFFYVWLSKICVAHIGKWCVRDWVSIVRYFRMSREYPK
jgi:hypothetical protein